MTQRILGLDPGLAILGFGALDCPLTSTDDHGSVHPLPTRSFSTESVAAESLPTKSWTIKSSSAQASSGQASIKMVDFGVIRTPAHTDLGQRLTIIYNDLHTLMRELQPDVVALEKFFFYRMGNTIPIAQARGVTLLVLAQYHITPLEFTPAQIKQALTGYGRADKSMVQQAVATELNLAHIPKPDDAADALAVALTAWFQQSMGGFL